MLNTDYAMICILNAGVYYRHIFFIIIIFALDLMVKQFFLLYFNEVDDNLHFFSLLTHCIETENGDKIISAKMSAC